MSRCANVAAATVRDAATGEILRLPEDLRLDQEFAFERWLQERGTEEIDVLLVADDGFDVTGSHLGRVSRAYDETARPCVNFSMNREGAARMEGLTSTNLPDERRGTYRLLGIVLDGTLLSAPRVMSTITDSGRITGQFTQEEVDFIVSILQAGSLPVALGNVPLEETTFSPSEARRQATDSIVAATLILLAAIWLLLLVRYRRIGLAAAWASLLQLLLVLAAIELAHVPVTMSAVVAAAAPLLVAAGGNAWLCESVYRTLRGAATPPRQLGLSVVRIAGSLAALLAIPWMASVLAYVLTDDPLRSAAAAVFLASMAAVATSCLCLPLLIGILAAGRTDPNPEEADVVAELVNPAAPSAAAHCSHLPARNPR